MLFWSACGVVLRRGLKATAADARKWRKRSLALLAGVPLLALLLLGLRGAYVTSVLRAADIDPTAVAEIWDEAMQIALCDALGQAVFLTVPALAVALILRCRRREG